MVAVSTPPRDRTANLPQPPQPRRGDRKVAVGARPRTGPPKPPQPRTGRAARISCQSGLTKRYWGVSLGHGSTEPDSAPTGPRRANRKRSCDAALGPRRLHVILRVRHPRGLWLVSCGHTRSHRPNVQVRYQIRSFRHDPCFFGAIPATASNGTDRNLSHSPQFSASGWPNGILRLLS